MARFVAAAVLALCLCATVPAARIDRADMAQRRSFLEAEANALLGTSAQHALMSESEAQIMLDTAAEQYCNAQSNCVTCAMHTRCGWCGTSNGCVLASRSSCVTISQCPMPSHTYVEAGLSGGMTDTSVVADADYVEVLPCKAGDVTCQNQLAAQTASDSSEPGSGSRTVSFSSSSRSSNAQKIESSYGGSDRAYGSSESSAYWSESSHPQSSRESLHSNSYTSSSAVGSSSSVPGLDVDWLSELEKRVTSIESNLMAASGISKAQSSHELSSVLHSLSGSSSSHSSSSDSSDDDDDSQSSSSLSSSSASSSSSSASRSSSSASSQSTTQSSSMSTQSASLQTSMETASSLVSKAQETLSSSQSTKSVSKKA